MVAAAEQSDQDFLIFTRSGWEVTVLDYITASYIINVLFEADTFRSRSLEHWPLTETVNAY